jgi:hypothetical protein
MSAGASTPEELESLLEDAFVVRDAAAVSALFTPGAVLAAAGMPAVARGEQAIQALVARLWECDQTYIADLKTVLQARDTALVVACDAISVVRRGYDGWQYAISLLASPDLPPPPLGSGSR